MSSEAPEWPGPMEIGDLFEHKHDFAGDGFKVNSDGSRTFTGQCLGRLKIIKFGVAPIWAIAECTQPGCGHQATIFE